ncbi:hypothetical protein WT12_28880 [Burkholderia territorii]|nr:hypothetical protein WT12_28880 [Burkholderia territorii]
MHMCVAQRADVFELALGQCIIQNAQQVEMPLMHQIIVAWTFINALRFLPDVALQFIEPAGAHATTRGNVRRMFDQ